MRKEAVLLGRASGLQSADDWSCSSILAESGRSHPSSWVRHPQARQVFVSWSTRQACWMDGARGREAPLGDGGGRSSSDTNECYQQEKGESL